MVNHRQLIFICVHLTIMAIVWWCYVMTFVTGICPKTFVEKSHWKEHFDVHSNDRQCGLCGEKTNSLSQLLAHRLTHVPPKQHKCHICNKSYKSCLYLEHHYRISHIHQDVSIVICSLYIFCLASLQSVRCYLVETA